MAKKDRPYEEWNSSWLSKMMAEGMKAHMRKLRLSQLDLAYRSGVSPSTIVNFFNGKVDPTLGTIQKILNGMDAVLIWRIESTGVEDSNDEDN